ncbi:hypothetical protein A2851_02050 [Candidatus Kaiserbacteria bacterium RIFCSPHIGHO2_01_FULL_53_29]|uniref:Plasmid stabilization protein n=1 Tax=Candidatus Kaiserbacteria bacterium RIFCSPHIGHO2_01_FULL_53_29 TaxID=1798480 RepID=A0A1F6CX56_9BACT|nr:MAG: hypothetical protein A2851_02050 [Candidatus Kaiserbacteria bacterium RIFCSPHIGHO2_01_FULL_53_29]
MKDPQYTLEARRHIAEIYSYIKDQNPSAAVGVVVRIHLTVRSLGLFPRMGRIGSAPRTYELLVKGLPFVIVYELRRGKGEVIILGIFHGAQDR